ncbi:selenocysteine-specific translation elongation factor [Soehngenia saccharolytica]|nr:selenocysteine-specific translation elongation factor [Soehngenia saccharolytica]
MNHIIIGTAGHIDHGKTTLIKALTGRETDRLKEEKERGISIELGFTYFDLPSGQRAGIIDVPGHEKFIRNMLAGVIGIDIILFVVAADEGVMPQTIEHLAILDLIGVKNGFVVITKSDLVDEDWLELVKEEIKESVKGTFLENSKIIPVSSTKRIGINEVIEEINRLSNLIEPKDTNDLPRLPIDRVFTIQGFGTVVTGTLLSGVLKVGDEVEVYPKSIITKIRNLQVHDKDVKEAYAGQRVAVNLANVKKDEISRGDCIAPRDTMKETMMLDVKVKLLKNLEKPIENRTRLKLYLGTDEIMCRIVLLDRDILEPGEEAFAQLRLEEKTVAKAKDRFILRFYSPMFTVGGGEILVANPGKRKRYDEDIIEELALKEEGTILDHIENILINEKNIFYSTKDIAVELSLLETNIVNEVKRLEDEGKVVNFEINKEIFPVHVNKLQDLIDSIKIELEDFHKKYPLRYGIPKEEIRTKYLGKNKQKLGDMIIEYLINKRVIKQFKDLLALPDFEPSLSDSDNIIKDSIIDILDREGFNLTKIDDMLILANKYDKKKIENLVFYMINTGDIIKLGDDYIISSSKYETAKEILRDYLKENEFITVPIYRDLLKTNRKFAIALLEHFDQIKLTKRDDDKRYLIE